MAAQLTRGGTVRLSECPHHPAGEYRECHHVGTDYVAVWWSAGMRGWISTYGTIGKRGSVSAFADKELSYMLEKLRTETSPTIERQG